MYWGRRFKCEFVTPGHAEDCGSVVPLSGGDVKLTTDSLRRTLYLTNQNEKQQRVNGIFHSTALTASY